MKTGSEAQEDSGEESDFVTPTNTPKAKRAQIVPKAPRRQRRSSRILKGKGKQKAAIEISSSDDDEKFAKAGETDTTDEEITKTLAVSKKEFFLAGKIGESSSTRESSATLPSRSSTASVAASTSASLSVITQTDVPPSNASQSGLFLGSDSDIEEVFKPEYISNESLKRKRSKSPSVSSVDSAGYWSDKWVEKPKNPFA
ncbi:hypothetical protein CVT26_002358 [Gymnopilus dilepis]|uniref:Uncharacterized protein n=1 Tax=Gymnopilus dilepis TaxID=231916 RepID=A0A409YNE1_9AGAR|nr:hypothetical protein CVT26_002358 [Gymnopilus dilepis]